MAGSAQSIRDDLAAAYLESLPFEPYPVQEDALLAWFTAQQGVLVCAPTGTCKTLIAEAALYEALHTGRVAYYTTPLIALTEQKFHELQEKAIEWGFHPDDVGLVTGNRRVNPNARILVVVAEILFNRLLHREQFEFDRVAAVVMDEFHSFSDPERGIVWELSLGLLPAHVRLLLLSATVGNAYEFTAWMRRSHQRDVELVESDERKVPLSYEWVGDQLLSEHLEAMAAGDEENRRTPALVFCFNREECWNVAEQLKGKKIVSSECKATLAEVLKQYDWSQGAGPKLKQILQRGVGVHHAGVLPMYRRIVEQLFQRKLLSVAVCTETLSAGINLPARSVVLPNLLKGPRDNKKVVAASTAHQIFGRAGRPQFDDRGYVYVLAHEDDVKIQRWREKYDQIPEKTKDPGLIKAKKALKRKMPKRRANQHYWTAAQFEKLQTAASGKLRSKGFLPWRVLAYLLDASPEIKPIRELIGKRLLDEKSILAGQQQLDRMLMTLWKAGYVELEPAPPRQESEPSGEESSRLDKDGKNVAAQDTPSGGLFGQLLTPGEREQPAAQKTDAEDASDKHPPRYRPEVAHPTDRLALLSHFRGVNPLFGVFLVNQLGIADENERIQALEGALEFPASVARDVRVPSVDRMPPGPLATTRLDPYLLRLGLVSAEELGATTDENDDDDDRRFDRDRPRVLTLAEKLQMQFNYDFPGVDMRRVQSVWVAGALFEYGDDFNAMVMGKKLQKQEGIAFRHLLRLILLINEFTALTPTDIDAGQWRGDLTELGDRITNSCRRVDSQSTQKVLAEVEAQAAAEMEADNTK
jgi:superfamily II DNA/RNA helicase